MGRVLFLDESKKNPGKDTDVMRRKNGQRAKKDQETLIQNTLMQAG